MPLPPIDLHYYIRQIPLHTAGMAVEADVPLRHYSRAARESWNLLPYFERNVAKAGAQPAVADRHQQQLRTMVLLSIVEAFERFLKELAACCVDQVATLVADDRLDVFAARGSSFAMHFAAGQLGRTLCELNTWCDCDSTNGRFRSVLADPYDDGKFYVFPKVSKQQPLALQGRYEAMSIIWQLRHTIVHNRATLTASDATQFRLLCRTLVAGPRTLAPTRGDVWYVKRFLDETAALISTAVGQRAAELLTTLVAADPTLFDPPAKAALMAELCQTTVKIAGATASPA